MDRVAAPKSALVRIIFGAGRLHRLPFAASRQRVLSTAYEVGFRAFDTAPAYGNGLSEAELGLALRGKRAETEINTKFGIPLRIYESSSRHYFPLRRIADILTGESASSYRARDFSAASLESSVHASLRRLRTDYIDTLFVHEPIAALGRSTLDEIRACGERLKKDGKIRRLGIAGPWSSIMRCDSLDPFESIQLPYEDRHLVAPPRLGRKVLFYGIYRNFRASSGAMSFPEFVKTALESDSTTGMILSSRSPTTLRSFAGLFT